MSGDGFPIPRIIKSETRLETRVSDAERAVQDRVDRHLDAAEQALGWIGNRRREPYRTARLIDDRVRAFIELTRLAEEEHPRTACWQALENVGEKLAIEEDCSEQGKALRSVRGYLRDAQ